MSFHLCIILCYAATGVYLNISHDIYRDRYKSESKDREKYYNTNNREREPYQGGYLRERTSQRAASTGAREAVYAAPQPREARGRGQGDTRDIYAVPHKIIYDTTTQGSPFTKFRTRIVINSETGWAEISDNTIILTEWRASNIINTIKKLTPVVRFFQ